MDLTKEAEEEVPRTRSRSGGQRTRTDGEGQNQEAPCDDETSRENVNTQRRALRNLLTALRSPRPVRRNRMLALLGE